MLDTNQQRLPPHREPTSATCRRKHRSSRTEKTIRSGGKSLASSVKTSKRKSRKLKVPLPETFTPDEFRHRIAPALKDSHPFGGDLRGALKLSFPSGQMRGPMGTIKTASHLVPNNQKKPTDGMMLRCSRLEDTAKWSCQDRGEQNQLGNDASDQNGQHQPSEPLRRGKRAEGKYGQPKPANASGLQGRCSALAIRRDNGSPPISQGQHIPTIP